MALDFTKKNTSESKVMSGDMLFSVKTLTLVQKCFNELRESGIYSGNNLVYFRKEHWLWKLYFWSKNLGYLDYSDNSDKTFKELLDSVHSDFQGDFDTLIFPNTVSDNPFGGHLTVLSNEGVGVLEELKHSHIKVVAHSNRNKVPLSLNNFCFSKGNGLALRNMMISCESATEMAAKLNRSGFGYRNWKPYKDDYKMMAITCTDTLENTYFIKVMFPQYEITF